MNKLSPPDLKARFQVDLSICLWHVLTLLGLSCHSFYAYLKLKLLKNHNLTFTYQLELGMVQNLSFFLKF